MSKTVIAVRFLAFPNEYLITAHPMGNDAAESFFLDMETAELFMSKEIRRGNIVFEYERIEVSA